MKRPERAAPTTAQRIDAAISAAANARAILASAQKQYEDRQSVLVHLAEKHGIPDGDSYRLSGRYYRCTLTQRHYIVIDRDQVVRLNRSWRRMLCWRVVQFSPTPYLVRIIHSRRLRLSLPRHVRNFLKAGITVSRSWALRFDGSSKGK